jgi:hypothetical protein
MMPDVHQAMRASERRIFISPESHSFNMISAVILAV